MYYVTSVKIVVLCQCILSVLSGLRVLLLSINGMEWNVVDMSS